MARWRYVHENKKSFRTGEPENSGLSKIQLQKVSSTYKYCGGMDMIVGEGNER